MFSYAVAGQITNHGRRHGFWGFDGCAPVASGCDKPDEASGREPGRACKNDPIHGRLAQLYRLGPLDGRPVKC